MPPPTDPDAEIQELEAEIARLTRFMRRAPWSGLAVFLAIPVGLSFGAMAGWSVAVAAASSTGIAIYIPYLHRFERRERLAELRQARA